MQNAHSISCNMVYTPGKIETAGRFDRFKKATDMYHCNDFISRLKKNVYQEKQLGVTFDIQMMPRRL